MDDNQKYIIYKPKDHQTRTYDIDLYYYKPRHANNTVPHRFYLVTKLIILQLYYHYIIIIVFDIECKSGMKSFVQKWN